MKTSAWPLRALIRLNLLILGVLLVLGVVLWISNFLFEVIALVSTCILLSYILLGPIQTIERYLTHWTQKIPVRFLPAVRPTVVLLTMGLAAGLVIIFILQVLPALVGELKAFWQQLPTYLEQAQQEIQNLALNYPWLFQTGNSNQFFSRFHYPLPSVLDFLQSHLNMMNETNIPLTLKGFSEQLANTSQYAQSLPDTTAHLPAAAPMAQAAMPATPDAFLDEPIIARESLQWPTLSSGLSSNLAQSLAQNLGAPLFSNLGNLGTFTLTGLVYGLTAVVFMFYLLTDSRAIKEGCIALLPETFQARFRHFLNYAHQKLSRFLQAQIILGFASGTLLFMLLTFSDVPFAGILAFIYGISSIIPVLGTWLGLLPTLIVLSFSATEVAFWLVLSCLGGFYLVKESMISPKWFPKFRIHPVLIILSFLACLKIAGTWGVLLTFPLAAATGVVIFYLQSVQQQPPSLNPPPPQEAAAG